jgi:hypothetical protein
MIPFQEIQNYFWFMRWSFSVNYMQKNSKAKYLLANLCFLVEASAWM